MKTNNDIRQQAIERLVDGELSNEAERDLLESFEQDSSGWKQLAQMFLEDRILRETLGKNSQSVSPVVDRRDSNDARLNRSKVLAKFVSVAALILVAFISGRYSSAAPEPGSSARIAETPQTPEPKPDDGQLPPAIEIVKLSLSAANEESAQIEVPLIPWEQAAASYSAEMVPELEPLIPEDVREILARNGQTIDEQMTYVPFEMPDGRMGIIPVSNIELRPNRYPEVQ